jgi:hypothetical protein
MKRFGVPSHYCLEGKMEHTQAIQLKAAERYVLGDLPADLREQYEDHFFSCQECAEELKLTAAFAENTRAALESQPQPFTARTPSRAAQAPSRGGWFAGLLRPSFAVPVFAVLLLFVAYQNIATIPNLKASATQSLAPQTLPSFSLITANSRGGEPLTVTVPAAKPFSLYLDVPPDNRFSSYTCEIASDSGSAEYSLNISAAEAQNAVQLLIPAATLKAGKHVLIVRGIGAPQSAGGPQTEVVRYPFMLGNSN